MNDQKELLKSLPKVDECMNQLIAEDEIDVPLSLIKKAIQQEIENERKAILASLSTRQPSAAEWLSRFKSRIVQLHTPKFTRVINGTGVVVHTNLGRSLLPEKTIQMLTQAAGYYANLEFDLETGKRGSRYSLVEDLLCELTGAEAALVVNNNAAAVLLSLDTLAKGREAIVSRGQLVEIGGSFRIPDVMAKSGATLIEVGATNRTHLYDYERAITGDTALLLRVHTSNFRIIGFTKEVSAEDLVRLARKNDIATMEDLGSGCLVDLSPFGFPKEPTVQEIVRAGVDVVTFSGDKLLGGPQAGIIVGRAEVIAKIKRNPLNRALRIDKFTLSGLEGVLREYLDVSTAFKSIPTLAMLTVPLKVLKKRAAKLKRLINTHLAEHCQVEIRPTTSRVGGGALPDVNLPSYAIHLQIPGYKASDLERRFRSLVLPVIGRIEDDRFLLDVRTIQEKELTELVKSIGKATVAGGAF
jgi:L-seryl-tRNA(Ser) seleniumtransferase